MQATHSTPASEIRRQYLRPLWLSIALSIFGELLIFLIFGVYLYPNGNLLNKFLWTVVFCGIGMGATVGSLINLFLVGRWQGTKAVLSTTGISIMVLGIACDLLCLNLDQTFQYFGGSENANLFLGNGILMAGVGGAIAGTLLFTDPGRKILARFSI